MDPRNPAQINSDAKLNEFLSHPYSTIKKEQLPGFPDNTCWPYIGCGKCSITNCPKLHPEHKPLSPVMCAQFKHGFCMKGLKCKFSHYKSVN